jgi:APA family basic amino acid/polyamine antiporter
MSADDYKLVTGEIGLVGAVGLLVGTAIGMSIFIVPTQMLVAAGPSITVAIGVSIIPMIFGVLGLLQLGGAIPVAGGAYVYCSRLVGPYWGLLGIAVPVLAIWAYLLFAAMGFAEYLAFFVDSFSASIPTLVVVWALLAAFLLLNYVGVQLVVRVQLAMVAALVGGLLTFIIVGALGIETGNYSPLFPAEGTGAPFADGFSPLLIAIVTLYIPFQGFGMVVEIGEELKNPIKNIPRVLAIGMSIVVAISLAVVVVLAGVLPWERAEAVIGDGGGLAAVAETFTSGEVAAMIAIAALIGAATTINTLFTSYSRTIMRAGRDDVVPSSFASVYARYGTPTAAILALRVPPIFHAPAAIYANSVFAVDMLDWLVTVTVTGIFVAFALLGIALWRLPRIFPSRYEHSFYRLPKPLLKVVAVGNTLVSIIFGVFVVLSQPTAFLVVLGWIAVATVVHRYRVRKYEKKGIDLTERMSSLHSHE